jgi:hypothetical protein
MNCIKNAYSRAQLVSQLAYTFDVTEPFMDARLKMIEDRVRALAAEHQMSQVISEHRATYDYSYCHPFNNRIEYLVIKRGSAPTYKEDATWHKNS